jgi:hypothetical protein
MRSRTSAVVIGLFFFLASNVYARTGVVLIHGKGGSELEQQAIADRYWGADMRSVLSKNGTVPILVCHYDGTQSMAAAADVVATEIREWVRRESVDRIIVHTHSFGGVVIRWILSNSRTYSDINGSIRYVNSIAPPNAGSEAADLAGKLATARRTRWLVRIAGQNNQSTKNCTTGAMAYYNQYYLKGTRGRPSLPVPLFNVAGTGLLNDVLHWEDRALSALSALAGLPGEDDGMVAQYSAQAAGEAKFVTRANHHHNKRNDYRHIGSELAKSY